MYPRVIGVKGAKIPKLLLHFQTGQRVVGVALCLLSFIYKYNMQHSLPLLPHLFSHSAFVSKLLSKKKKKHM
jgi:hypothetical protein